MWLLKFHIAFGILCLITFIGFAKVFREQLKENGWKDSKKKKRFTNLLVFFVPGLNVLLIITLFLMLCITKEKFYELKNENK